MIGSFPLDLTSVLVPFGWAGATIVIVGLTALVVAAMRAGRPRRDLAIEPACRQDPRLAA
jgi:phage/plasmid primase-like uncharacterized protein